MDHQGEGAVPAQVVDAQPDLITGMTGATGVDGAEQPFEITVVAARLAPARPAGAARIGVGGMLDTNHAGWVQTGAETGEHASLGGGLVGSARCGGV